MLSIGASLLYFEFAKVLSAGQLIVYVSNFVAFGRVVTWENLLLCFLDPQRADKCLKHMKDSFFHVSRLVGFSGCPFPSTVCRLYFIYT